MSKSILNEGNSLHIFSSIRIIISIGVKDHIQIKLSWSDVKFIIPKVQRKERHWELLFEVLSDLNGELFDVCNEVIILGFIKEF